MCSEVIEWETFLKNDLIIWFTASTMSNQVDRPTRSLAYSFLSLRVICNCDRIAKIIHTIITYSILSKQTIHILKIFCQIHSNELDKSHNIKRLLEIKSTCL